MQASQQILSILLFVFINSSVISRAQQTNPFTSSSSNGKARYKTVYACEDRMLHIECEYGTRINLIRANYGRFSITQCNEQGQLDLSTDCVSPTTVRIMRKECQDKQSCSVNSTSTIFGDKCPRTRKYLEAHFQCVPISEISTIETVNLRTSTTPSPPHSPNDAPTYVLGGSGGHIQPPNNNLSPMGAHSSSSNRPHILDSGDRIVQPNLAPSSLPSGSYPHQVSTSIYQQQQQPKTVMNSEILTYDAVNDLQSNYGPNKISSTSGSDSIVATFRHLHTENMSNPRCMLWNSNNHEWTPRGARVIESNSTHTTCAFDTPASYSLVMDYMSAQPQTVSILHQNENSLSLPKGSTWCPFLSTHSSTDQYKPILFNSSKVSTLDPFISQTPTNQDPRVPAGIPILQKLDPVVPGLLDGQPVVVDPFYQPNTNNNRNGQQQQQQSNGTNPSPVVSFFSLFGYFLAFIFVLVALMTMAFVASSMRSSAGATLKSLGNFTAFSGPKYKNGRRADGSPHLNKDLLVVNNQNGHQFFYTPTSTTKINSSASTHILTSSLPGQHQGTLHQIQQQQQHQLYSGNGTLSNLSGTGGQSNNYYYQGLTNGFNQYFQQQQQHQQHLSQLNNNQQASYHHQANKSTISNESANSSPSSSGVESGSASMHQPQQQQQQPTCSALNNDLNLMNHFGNYGQHQHQQPQNQNSLAGLSMQDHHTTLTLNAHYNSSVMPMRFSNMQNNGHMREQHIYECVDDDKNYSARLLLPIEQFNSNTLSNHQSATSQMNMGAAHRSAMTLSRFHQQQPQQMQSQQLSQTNKRLNPHPAIVRDNQPTKTNIICSQMAQVVPQRATEINKYQQDVMAVFKNDSTATTTTGPASMLTANKLSTDC